jgi:hypothetical protein
MNDNQDWQMTNREKGGGQMPCGSTPNTKKISKKASTKHHPGDRFQDLMGGDFFNGAFRKSLLLSHESPTRKQLFPWITG